MLVELPAVGACFAGQFTKLHLAKVTAAADDRGLAKP